MEARIERIEQMLAEIYHHLGLDGATVISMQDIKDQVATDVLKWAAKRAKRGNEREKAD